MSRGQALAELAIVVPMVVILLGGIIDFGTFARSDILLANAARAGVQYGAQNPVTAADDAGMEAAATSDGAGLGASAVASSFCTCADGTASTCQPADCSSSHRLSYVQVAVTATFSPLFGYPGAPGSIAVTQTATMQVSP